MGLKRVRKTTQMGRWARLGTPRTLVVLIALATAGVFLFPAVSEGGNSSLPNMRTSTAGKTGVTPPTGVGIASTTPVRAVLGASTKIASTAAQKPAWTRLQLFVDPTNEAAQYLADNPGVSGAAYIARMAQVPVAEWFGDWNSNITNDISSYVSAAAAKNSVPVVVAYNIPNRDCGGYSTGGTNDIAGYTQWIKQVAAGIGNRTAVVIVEPDALGALDCLSAPAQTERLQSIAQAITILKANSKTAVYIDAGTPVWQPAQTMAVRLKAANVAAADGFSLNISYFAPTSQNLTYGNTLSGLVGNKHYVIDTSRNGGNHQVTGAQCNPSFASFGQAPTTNTTSSLNDALLWIKIPWESDGPCNGSPGPGQVYWSYALQLAQNAGW